MRDEYPYLIQGHMYQYDLHWIIENIKNIWIEIDSSVELHTIKYADPIQWDITTQYQANTVVVDPKTGTAYISTKPVPSGILLTDTNYWTVVFNFQKVYTDIMKNISAHYVDGKTSTFDLKTNELVWFEDDLYYALHDINIGDALVPDANIKKTTVEDMLKISFRENMLNFIGGNRTTTLDNDILNVSGDWTVKSGDRTFTSTNATETISGDENRTIDGTKNEHVKNEASFTFDNDVKIHLANHAILDLNNLPVLNVNYYGILPNGEDVANNLQDVINKFASTKVIYIPFGTYTLNHKIIINHHKTIFICDGILKCAEDGLELNSSDVIIYINRLMGSGNGEGLKIATTNSAIGNSNITINFINNFSTGITLFSDGDGGGIQNEIFYLTRIDNCNSGIVLTCGNNGKPWINQNTFYGGWIFAGTNKPSAKGIVFNKGQNQSDRFNGNSFNNFSCEGTRYPIEIHFAWHNTFNGMRLLENEGDNLISCDSQCEENKFIGTSAYIDFSSINDAGINNIYEMAFAHNHENKCTKALGIKGTVIPVEGYAFKREITLTQGTSLPEYDPISVLIFDGTTYNVEAILNPIYSYSITANPFVLITKTLSGFGRVKLYNGTVIATTESTTSQSGIQLEANSKYLFIPIADNQYRVIKIA